MEKVRILAFDPGTANMGYAIVQGDVRTSNIELTDVYGVLTSSLKDGDIRTRVDLLSAKLAKLITATQPTHVTIEDYVEQGVRSGTTYKDMTMLIENMRLTCRTLGYEANILANAEWKKIAVGTKGLNKKQIQHFVTHRVKGTHVLGSRNSDTHVWDSVGIGYAQFKLLQGVQ